MTTGILMLVLFSGCLRVPDSLDSDSDSDSDAYDTDSDTDTEPTFIGAQDCDWAGTWLMTQPRCDAAAFSQWFDSYDTTTMVMEHNITRGCDVTFTLSKVGACTETESWYVLEDLGNSTWNIDSKGIVECDPGACQFADADAPCEVGARDNDVEVQVNDAMDGVLDFTFLVAYAAPACDGALRLKFERQ